MSTSHKNSVLFPQIDILRIVSAYTIIVGHTYILWCSAFGYPVFLLQPHSKSKFTLIGASINMLIRNSSIGVEFFFLISGFLITYLLLEEKKRMNKVNIFNFYIRRLLRIWPLYFFILAITPFFVFWLKIPSPNYWVNIFFINNFNAIHQGHFSLPFPHFWSISVEEHFYIVWPLFISFVPRKKLPYVFYSIILVSILFRIYLFMFVPNYNFVIYLHTLSRIDVITIGGIIAYYIEYLSKIRIPGLGRIIIYLLLIFALCRSSWNDCNSIIQVAFRKYFYTVLISMAFINYCFNPRAKFQLKRNKFLHYLGKISYGIYMYQEIVIHAIFDKWLIPMHISSIVICVLLITCSIIVISIISYELLEKPFLRIKNRFEIIKN